MSAARSRTARAKWRAACLLASTLAACAAVPLVACQDDVIGAASCGEIPAGGCPRRGGACSDGTCAALYTCSADGMWTRVQTCPARDGHVDASIERDAGDRDASRRDAGSRDASAFEVPGAFGGPGCSPLEPPDCPLGRMASCPDEQCCGCEDLFVCRSGGWELWGACDGGAVRPAALNSP